MATWLFLCLIPWLESGTESYAAWRAAGCPLPGVPGAACLPEQNHLARGLVLFLISAPFLAWALVRTPREWPAQLNFLWWNKEKPAFSLASAGLLAAVLASAALRGAQAPYASAHWTNGIALALILLAGVLYRAVHLSAATDAATGTRPS